MAGCWERKVATSVRLKVWILLVLLGFKCVMLVIDKGINYVQGKVTCVSGIQATVKSKLQDSMCVVCVKYVSNGRVR